MDSIARDLPGDFQATVLPHQPPVALFRSHFLTLTHIPSLSHTLHRRMTDSSKRNRLLLSSGARAFSSLSARAARIDHRYNARRHVFSSSRAPSDSSPKDPRFSRVFPCDLPRGQSRSAHPARAPLRSRSARLGGRITRPSARCQLIQTRPLARVSPVE